MIFLLVFLATLTLINAVDPYSAGPHQVGFIEYHMNDTGLDHHFGVFAPNTSGIFPVIYFASAFADMLTPASYTTLFSRVASHGYAIAAPHRTEMGTSTEEFDAQWLKDFIDWCQFNLLDLLLTSGFNGGLNLDFINTFLSGHSAGSHIICNYLKELGCGTTKGVIMMSPVDGTDPFGLDPNPNYCTIPGTSLNFETPTVILPAGLDSVSGHEGPFWPPCAPEELSNQRFYDAFRGPVYMINATEYGHIDINDADTFISGMVNMTHGCAQNPTTTDNYRHFVAGEFIAFLEAVYKGDCSMLNYLQDPGLMPEAVEVNSKGTALSPCNNGRCNWLPPT